MVKNVVMGILVILCLTSFVYALVQKTAAMKAQKEALYSREIAEKNAILAQYQQAEATKSLEVARAQQLIAEQSLLDCRKGKK